jgi:glycosyltransferase involved in cell wall biosynthesis
MRIGFDAKRLFLNTTGLGNYSRDLLMSLADHFPDDEYLLYTPKYAVSPVIEKLLSRHTVHLKTPQGIGRLFPGLWRSLLIEGRLIRDEVQIYHGLSAEIPKRSPHTNIRYVVSVHDIIFRLFPEYYNPVDRLIYDRKLDYAVHNSDMIIAASQSARKDLINHFGASEERIEVIYQSCSAIFSKKIPSGAKKAVREKYRLPEEYLLCVGTIEPRKNLEVLLRAIHGIDLPLVVIGRKTEYYRNVVFPLIKSLGLVSRVLLPVQVLSDDLPAVYQSASVFIYPSRYEGFGIPVLEALASGIPVITSTSSSMPEVGGDAALYFDPDDCEGLQNAIRKVLEDSRLRAGMTARGTVQSERFSPQRHAAGVHKLYFKLVN